MIVPVNVKGVPVNVVAVLLVVTSPVFEDSLKADVPAAIVYSGATLSFISTQTVVIDGVETKIPNRFAAEVTVLRLMLACRRPGPNRRLKTPPPVAGLVITLSVQLKVISGVGPAKLISVIGAKAKKIGVVTIVLFDTVALPLKILDAMGTTLSMVSVLESMSVVPEVNAARTFIITRD